MIEKNTLLKIDNLRTYFHNEEGLVKAVDGVSFNINVMRHEIFQPSGQAFHQ